jgi:hypothetical protein
MLGVFIMATFPPAKFFIRWAYLTAPVLAEQIGWGIFTGRMLLGLIVILIISWIFISIFLYSLISFIRRYPRFSLLVLSLALITY